MGRIPCSSKSSKSTPRPHNQPFRLQNRLQRIFLSAIASSTASGVLCGPISGHFEMHMATKSHSTLAKWGVNPHLSSWNGFLWPEIGPQSTPEAVDEAIALNKNTPEPILRSKRPVVRPGGSILRILSCMEFSLYSHSTPLHSTPSL